MKRQEVNFRFEPYLFNRMFFQNKINDKLFSIDESVFSVYICLLKELKNESWT